MSNPFINSSFTLRPSTNDRDKPELTLRQTEHSRIPKETKKSGVFVSRGRAFKRQRLFMDRFMSSTFSQGFRFACYDGAYGNEEQYISDDDDYNPPVTLRRVSHEFPLRSRVSIGGSTRSIGMGLSEAEYWRSQCLGIQSMFDESQHQLKESEEDQRQLRQRIRELEEQLLLQSSSANEVTSYRNNEIEGEMDNHQNNAKHTGGIIKANEKGEDEITVNDEDEEELEENVTKRKKKRLLPALVVEIKENHQAVSSCFYLSDGEGLNESYDLDMEEDDVSMDIYYRDEVLDDIDDRNDMNINQRRG